MAIFRFLLLLCLPCCLASCARSFVKPDVTAVAYVPAGSTASQLDFDLSPAPIPLLKPFDRKLNKAGIELYAVRVSNLTADTVQMHAGDVQLTAESMALPRVTSRKVYKSLRQPVALHALWFLVGPMIKTNGDEKRLDYHPIGTAFVAWGLGNGIVAYRANREVKEMLQFTMPTGTTAVAPRQHLYLLIPLRERASASPVELRYATPTK